MTWIPLSGMGGGAGRFHCQVWGEGLGGSTVRYGGGAGRFHCQVWGEGLGGSTVRYGGEGLGGSMHWPDLLSSISYHFRHESSKALGLLARLHPAVVQEGVLPRLLATLTTATPMETDTPVPPPPRVADHTNLLAAISTHHSIVSVTLPALLDYLQQLAREPYSSSNQELARTASESARVIVEGSMAEECCVTLVHEAIAPRVLSQCIAPAIASPLVESHVLTDEAVIGSCAALLRCYAQTLDVR